MPMTIEQMRWMDSFVGKPLCYFFGWYARVKYYVTGKKEKPVTTILLTKYLGMGSIVQATPLIKALKKRYPEAKIIFLTFYENRDFLKSLGLIDKVLSIKTDSFIGFTADLFRSLYNLRKEKISITLNLEFFSKFATIVSFLSAAPIIVGYYLREPWRTHLVTRKVYYNHYKHISQVFMALGTAIGVDSNDQSLSSPVINQEERQFIQHTLEHHGIEPSHFKVVVNVNSSSLSLNRCWPPAQFTSLIERIVTVYGAKIILIGGKRDIPRVASVVSSLSGNQNVVNLAGKTNIVQLLALMEQADLVITNDSGPLHLAVMMGTSTISFFGPESPIQFGPPEAHHRVLYKGYYCSPCLHVYNEKNSECKDNICLKDISVDEVLEIVAHYYKDWKNLPNGNS